MPAYQDNAVGICSGHGGYGRRVSRHHCRCVEDVADQIIGRIMADDYLNSVTTLHRNCNLIVEIKTLAGKLRQNQIDWLETWRGHGTVWRSIEDVEKALLVG